MGMSYPLLSLTVGEGIVAKVRNLAAASGTAQVKGMLLVMAILLLGMVEGGAVVLRSRGMVRENRGTRLVNMEWNETGKMKTREKEGGLERQETGDGIY